MVNPLIKVLKTEKNKMHERLKCYFQVTQVDIMENGNYYEPLQT